MVRHIGHATETKTTLETVESTPPITVVRVALLIPTHALPPLSYRVPDFLQDKIRPGSVVSAPLSSYSRLGVVVDIENVSEGRSLEELRDVFDWLSLDEEIVGVCRQVSDISAIPVAKVLRSALPPGLDLGNYRIVHPGPNWPWSRGTVVTRGALRRFLGPEGFKSAEELARVKLYPHCPEPPTEEWVTLKIDSEPDFGRAHAQRRLFEALSSTNEGDVRSADILKAAGATRATLLRLEERGVIHREHRPNLTALKTAFGQTSPDTETPFYSQVEDAMDASAVRLWRVPTAGQVEVAVAVARFAVDNGKQALIFAPEVEAVERIKRMLLECLPVKSVVAAYHGGMGKSRASIHAAARYGDVDVVVGTRSAALLPMPRLGGICVTDEPSESYRADPGYEGLPLHTRDIALERGATSGVSVLLTSPTPSLRLYGGDVEEIAARSATSWPAVRLVDMRGTGAILSDALVNACQNCIDSGGRVGVLVNRLGQAVSVSCNQCGAIRSCPNCGLPLALHGMGQSASMLCASCGHRERAEPNCPNCYSTRLNPLGISTERVRMDLHEKLGVEVGLRTAGERVDEDAAVVVGTAHGIQEGSWDVICIPDADALFVSASMGAVERGFRILYRATEAARTRLVVQTRLPEHYALQAALRGDYTSFAAAELPRLRTAGYPPYAHFAQVVIEGPESVVRDAVESSWRERLSPAVSMSAVVPAQSSGKRKAWRVLLRASERREAAEAATLAARLGGRGPKGLKVLIDVDPEEV